MMKPKSSQIQDPTKPNENFVDYLIYKIQHIHFSYGYFVDMKQDKVVIVCEKNPISKGVKYSTKSMVAKSISNLKLGVATTRIPQERSPLLGLFKECSYIKDSCLVYHLLVKVSTNI